ncbi:MAG: sodium:glutamate symporter [Spirochaetales bacterium]|nr:sodium:glutamate symporter [Spirochaetales bacterium]
MEFEWGFFIDLGIVGVALLLSTFLRSRIRFFQRYLIPNALTAGFFLLFFYNYLAPVMGVTSDGLGGFVYHLLSISFISMTLRKASGVTRGKSTFSMSVGVLSQYALQALLGLLMTFVMISTFLPGLFPSFGLFLPLGYVLGPGQAFAIGKGWEALGFEGSGTVGLTFAAFGFLWACFGGVFLINYGIRRGWMTKEQSAVLKDKGVTTGVIPKENEKPVGARLTMETEAIDSMTYHFVLVGIVYLSTYLLLKGLTFLLSFAGDLGVQLAVNLWGLSFIFAALMALLAKRVIRFLKLEYTLDNGSLTRISGTSVDLMVAASIGAISITIVVQYWLPILILCTLGGIVTIVTVPWICSRLFTDHKFHRTLIIYGACTGTMPTGLALLRVVDSEFETPAASEYMFSAGITFFLAIPFILIINLPAYSYTTGNPLYFWIAVAVSGGYLVYSLVAFLILSRRKAFASPSKIWHHEKPSNP